MSEQSLAWLLALAVAWRQPANDPHPEPARLSVDSVTGVSGRLTHHTVSAANDLEARVLILMWVWWWFSAKCCAKVTDSSAVSLIFPGAAFLSPISPSAAPLAGPRWVGSDFRQCQNDHLPTQVLPVSMG